MNNLDKLLASIHAVDIDALIKFLEEFAEWHDPGGWIDEVQITKYLLQESKEENE